MADSPTSSHRGYGRLARRLILLFVVASLVPLAVSDWLAIYATSDTNRSLQNKTELQRVRLVGRQVFDKLLNAKLLVGNFPADSIEASKLPGFGRVFSNARFVAGSDSASQDVLVRTWNAAKQPASASPRFQAKEESSHLDVSLRVARDEPTPRLLIGSSRGASLLWIAEINRDYLWSPVTDASEDSAWKVVDAFGALLMSSGPSPAAEFTPVRSRIFLGAEFDSDDWIFESDMIDATVAWQGLPIAAWLALVATTTLLLIAFLSLWKIREMLAPLTQLTDSTYSLAHGEMPTRVDVRRNDEIGELASAFNDMAARIAAQFATLSDLAAIDRDILKGASVRALGVRVVDQLASNRPNVTVRFEWIDPDQSIQRVTAKAGAAEFDVTETGSSREKIAQFLKLGDEASANNGFVVDCRGDVIETAIPIVLAGATRAAIVWSSSHNVDAEALLASFNLRDRMAVAFATRDREAELVHLATHDSLTGLASRHELHRVLEKITDSSESTHSSLLFIDLDHFKDINDSRGHHIGDELLCRVGERLRACCPDGAILARQGGDEFALVLAGLDENEACAIAAKILAEVKKPVPLASGECSLTASIGVAVFPTQARTREGLLRCADVALYAAKASGRNGFRVFNSVLDIAEQARVQLATDLRGATERAEFELYFQARVRSRDLKLSGAEALLR